MMPDDSCLHRQPSKPKVAAAGISIFLLEELGDARLRCAQLKKYVDEAVELIDKSNQREHFFEVAGHLLHGIPDTLLRMDKALSAAAMAAAKLDYEETKDDLRPEKVDELERALEEVRVRRVKRRSEITQASAETPTMKIPEAVAQMEHLAASVEATGAVDSAALANLIVQLEGPSMKTASATQEIAGVLRELSASLLDTSDPAHRPSRLALASTLRRVFGDTVTFIAAKTSDDTKESRFEEGKPADPTKEMSPEDAKEWKQNTDEHKDKFKTAAMHGLDTKVREALESAWENGEFQRNPGGAFDSKYLHDLDSAAKRAVASNPGRNGQPPRGALATLADAVVMFAYGLGMSHSTKTASSDEEKRSRFEEGKPADPTEHMDKDDAAKWKQQTDEHKDEFKSAGRKPKDTAEKHQLRVLLDTVKNPLKGMLGGPDAEEAEATLKSKFNYSDAEIKRLKQAGDSAAAAEAKRSRFEEGKPADPTEEMSPDDAKEWKQNTEEHKDNFKSAVSFKKTPTHWVEKDGRWLTAVTYASDGSWRWEISEVDGEFEIRVIAETTNTEYKRKQNANSLSAAKKFAERYVSVANGGEMIKEDLSKLFTRSKQVADWKA